MVTGKVVSIGGVPIKKMNSSEIMILELLDLIGKRTNEEAKEDVICFVNNDSRPLRKDTATILLARGFNLCEIPKLQQFI